MVTRRKRRNTPPERIRSGSEDQEAVDLSISEEKELHGPRHTPLFVVLEGIDGSGKTSVGKEVVHRLQEDGHPAYFTFEPSDLAIGKLLRQVLKGDTEADAHTHALLFAADREEHLRNVVIPHLDRGEIVVCDRYVYASMAYQGAKGVDMDLIWEINARLPHFRIPDQTLFLDVDPKMSLGRTTHRETVDIFETPAYLTNVRNNYHALFDNKTRISSFDIIDASHSFELVVTDVMEHIINGNSFESNPLP